MNVTTEGPQVVHVTEGELPPAAQVEGHVPMLAQAPPHITVPPSHGLMAYMTAFQAPQVS